MKKDTNKPEITPLSHKGESAVKDYIKDIEKNQSFYRKIRNRYLGIKYRIQDWLE